MIHSGLSISITSSLLLTIRITCYYNFQNLLTL